MVLGALEQVARNVSEEVEGRKRGGGTDDGLAESTLREGVRRWFQHVDSVAP